MMKWDEIHTAEEMDQRLDQEISSTRRHLFKIRLLKPDGTPCPGLTVKAVHQKHDFTFGVCPNGHISMTNRLACGEDQEADQYWEQIGDLFNGTSLWWGWRVLEPEPGAHTFDREIQGYGPMENMIKRAEELGHTLTAHAILYPRDDVSPQWLDSCTEEEALVRFREHVYRTVERYKDRISCWHPVNEAYDELQTPGALRVNEGLVYRWISDRAPHGCIVDNGGHTIDPDFYEKGIRNAALFGGRVDDLGVRGYFELYDPDAVLFYRRIWEHFNNLWKRYHRKIRFTEIGAVSAPRIGAYSPWDVDHTTAKLLGIADFDEFRENMPITEETQAEFLVRMYKLAFAHPKVKECSYWDLYDTYTWNEVAGGLIRPDRTPKPAYERLKELLHCAWSTWAELESGEDGACSFHGFDGMYEVQIGRERYTVHLNEKENEAVICLV